MGKARTKMEDKRVAKHSLDAKRPSASSKEKGNQRDAATVKRLNMYKKRAVRDKKGRILYEVLSFTHSLQLWFPCLADPVRAPRLPKSETCLAFGDFPPKSCPSSPFSVQSPHIPCAGEVYCFFPSLFFNRSCNQRSSRAHASNRTAAGLAIPV